MASYNANYLDPIFHHLISQNITLQEDAVQEVNCYLQNELLEKMIKEMKNDKTFYKLFVQPLYVGSYYENLRVGDPNEFDINLVLQLPLYDSVIQIETMDTTPGFARIEVGRMFIPNTHISVIRKIERWLCNGYLDTDKVFRWLQGVVDRALENICWSPDTKVKRSTSGPAVTLNICKGEKSFDVDLVPVFCFGIHRWPPPPVRQMCELPHHVNVYWDWCVVPKAPKGSKSRIEWRLSFYAQEKSMMKNQNNMKPVIKLFKLLRDNQNWNGLSSYYIKTVFMWEQLVQRNEIFWRNSLGYLFMHMLGRLQFYLQRRRIPFYWDQRCNLIAHLSKSEKSNMYGRVTRLKRKLERALSSNEDPGRVIYEYFILSYASHSPAFLKASYSDYCGNKVSKKGLCKRNAFLERVQKLKELNLNDWNYSDWFLLWL